MDESPVEIEGHPAVEPVDESQAAPPSDDQLEFGPVPASRVDADASLPDVLDLRASQRDDAAAVRDKAAQVREAMLLDVRDADQLTADRLLAARDRAAAALDRREAALDRHRAAEYLRRTYRDEMTGALQRAAGRDRLVQEIDRAHRGGQDLTVAFLDVDGLKQVNDQHGHRVGDELLRMVGQALREGLRSYDVVVRYGGDEFVCALPNTGRPEAIRRFAQVSDLLASLHPGVGFSLGLTGLAEGDTVDDVIGRADRDLYAGRSNLRRLRTAATAARPDPAGSEQPS
jgi:diguanylate cyclase (GGDEF)-like protein